MDITKDRILQLLQNAADMTGLDDILEDEEEIEEDENEEDVSVDFDEGIMSDLDVDEALPLIDNDALFDLIAKTIDEKASGDGEYNIKDEKITFLFQLIETDADEKCRIIPVSKTCKTQWNAFIDMLNSIVQEIKAMQTSTNAPATRFTLSFKKKET